MAYTATNAAINSTAKRYRYTGMERDEESGLSYHTARYYLPWLGRWFSADPIGVEGGMNVYEYALNNPIQKIDITGLQSTSVNSLDTQDPNNFSSFESYREANPEQPEDVVWDIWSTAHSNTPSAISSTMSEEVAQQPAPTPTNTPPPSTTRVIEPPPPVSPTDYTLYVREGFVHYQYRAAVREADNPDNSIPVRATFFVLGLAAGPLALAEEYISRPITNVPFTVHNAGIGIGEHAARAYLWSEQGETGEAVVEGLHVVRDSATGFVAAGSVAVPVAGAVESRLAANAQRSASTPIRTSGGTADRAQFERLRADLAEQELLGAEPVGSALKGAGPFSPRTFSSRIDLSHSAPTFARDMVGRGSHFTIRGGDGVYRNLTQVEGVVNGQAGIFEYIVGPRGLTHQRWIQGGRITGFPNQTVR